MPTNDFKAIASSGGANVATQAAFAANNALLTNGFPTGVVDSATFNKAWRQSSVIAAAVAQFISDKTGLDVLDDGDFAGLVAKLKRASYTGATGVTAINSATTLTATHAGQLINLFGTGGFTLTLPLGSTLTAGAVIEIDGSLTSGNVALVRQGTDTISVGSNSVTGLTLYAGSNIRMRWNGAAWQAVGESQLPYSPLFSSSTGASGYQKLPSGVIIQWGSITASAENTNATATFPIAFPGACRSVALTDSAAIANNAVVWATDALSASNFTAHWARSGMTLAGTNRVANYLAIGI